MITYFYKILYDNKDVVYVGVTTRTPQKRFQQHIRDKKLNPKDYSVIEFDRIVHPNIKSLDEYYEEYKKVAYLEKKYIKEERDKGSNLLNISDGGEWGGSILSKLIKENFFKKYGSYNGYEKYKKRIDKSKRFIWQWIRNRTTNKTKSWMFMWIRHSTENPTYVWLKSWKFVKTRSKTRIWVRHWIEHRSEPKIISWMYHWIEHRSETRFKVWMFNWVARRSRDGKIIK